MRIGTFNIQHGRNHRFYLDTGCETIDLAGVAQVLREAQVDICGLNEVRNQEQVAGLCNQARVIAEELGYHYVFAKAIDHRGGEYGNALVSRYPIIAHYTVPISVPVAQRAAKASRTYEDRVLLVATVETPTAPVTVMVCHFGLNPDEIRAAIDTVGAERQKLAGRVLLMGDFNLTPDSPYYGELAGEWMDTAVDPARPLTFPSHAPDRKIDYIFSGEPLAITDVTAPTVTQSDHLPYIVTIE